MKLRKVCSNPNDLGKYTKQLIVLSRLRKLEIINSLPIKEPCYHPSHRIIIVGGGLAGTLLATQLIEMGQQVTLVDGNQQGTASRVAAGLYNVITGRFGAKSWMAETLLPTLKGFLKEHPFLSPYVHPSHIYRPFKEVAEYNKWSGRMADPMYQDWVEFQEKPLLPERIHNELGGIFITPCGWIDVPGMVDALIGHLKKHESFTFIPVHLSHEAIDISQKKVRVGQESFPFDHIVFCEGFHAGQNPLFTGIPVIPNKGEILLIESPELKLDWVLSRKVYVIPLEKNQYVVGSSYKNKFDHLDPTPEGKAEICGHFEKAIKVPYRILDQKAGIRPTTPDRRPILGTHPDHSFVHICTGFGTKGLLLGPYITRMLADTILDRSSNIIPEVSLNRFRKKYNLK